MKLFSLVAHSFVVLVVAGLCAWELWRAFELYGSEYLALTYERTLTATLCGAYSLGHMVLLIKRRVTTQAFVLFYPVMLALGITASLAARGYGKGWAPADTDEALQSTAVAFAVVGSLSLVALLSCYYALVSVAKRGAQPGAPADAPPKGVAPLS
jgi:hypothetical protein